MKKLLFTLITAVLTTVLFFTACSEVDTTGAGMPPPAERIDKTALEESIAEAENLVKNTRINTAAESVPGNIYWVQQSAMNVFTSAINRAKTIALSSQNAVNTEKAALDNAIAVFKSARQKGAGENINTAALSVKISEAKKAKLGVEEIQVTRIIEEGEVIEELFEGIEDVALGARWVTKETMNDFGKAIDDAQDVYDTATFQNQIDAAVTTLETAIDAFITEIQTGTKENGFTQADLDAMISAAETVKTGILVRANDENGDDISPSLLWVTQEEIDALDEAITEAEGAANVNRDARLLALVNAINDFTGALQTGTVPDRDRLNTLIAEAESLIEASVDFKAVYEAAEEVFYNSDATKEEVDAAIAALTAAIAALD